MRKATMLFIIVLGLALAIGCASISPTPLPITNETDLRGVWDGTWQSVGGRGAFELEIRSAPPRYNGTVVWYGLAKGTTSFPFFGRMENGAIIHQIIYQGSRGGWIRFSLAESNGKLVLHGSYQEPGYLDATIVLYKK